MGREQLAVRATLPLYRQNRERYLYLYVTQECNLRCKHCYVGNNRLNAAHRFDLPNLDALLEYFKVTGGHDKLYILGGEPTLHPQLPEIVRLANRKQYSVTISSNGEFPESLFNEIPPDTLASFNFSLESWLPEVHTKIRGDSSNFGEVIGKIRLASRLGYQTRVMCTVSKANCDSALGLINFVAELGAHTLSFHNLGRTGNAVTRLTPLSPQEWMHFCREIESHEPVDNLAVYYPPTFVDKDEQEKWAARGYPGCPARTLDRPHVYPDGTVYACPLFMDAERYYGRFVDGQLLLNTRPDNELNAYFHLDDICRGCGSSGTCGGGCPAYSALSSYADGWYKCDRQLTPLCILWTTYAWGEKPREELHDFR